MQIEKMLLNLVSIITGLCGWIALLIIGVNIFFPFLILSLFYAYGTQAKKSKNGNLITKDSPLVFVHWFFAPAEIAFLIGYKLQEGLK